MRSLAASGCAMVLTGHEIPQILSLAHSVVWVRDGSTQLMGTAAHAEADWRFRRNYLGAR
jgi:ABC-type sugar transport system ATPase subunit